MDVDRDKVSIDSLEFIERLVFDELNRAIEKDSERSVSFKDEIFAYEQALDSITEIRQQFEEEQQRNISNVTFRL